MNSGTFKSLVCATLFAAAVLPVAAQNTQSAGVVTKIDADAKQLTLKTDAGAELSVTMSPKVAYRRVAPGERDVRNGQTIAIGDINVGDRALAVGKLEGTTVTASLIVIMSKADVAKTHAAEQAEWDKRGVIGIVTAASPEDIAIAVHGPGGTKKTLIITPGPKAADPAVCSGFDQVRGRQAVDARRDQDRRSGARVGRKERRRDQVDGGGDHLRVVQGDRGDDPFDRCGESLHARERSGDQETGDGQDQSGFEFAQASRANGADAGGAQPSAGRRRGARARRQSAEAVQKAEAGADRRARRRWRRDLTQMLERVPAVTLADLKAGDAIIVLSTVGASPDQMTAITMLAGVEPILTKPGTREMQLGRLESRRRSGASSQ